MLFKKKEGKELPDLPPSSLGIKQPSLEVLPSEENEEAEEKALPSFPNSSTYNKFSQTAIKDAVGEPEKMFEFPDTEKAQSEKISSEMEEWKPQNTNIKNFSVSPKEEESFVIPLASTTSLRSFARQKIGEERYKPAGDIYVKIDKFHLARRTLSDISEKLQEVDSLIKRIREIKLREEQELAVWERDINHIKARVKDVNENIFEKID